MGMLAFASTAINYKFCNIIFPFNKNPMILINRKFRIMPKFL